MADLKKDSFQTNDILFNLKHDIGNKYAKSASECLPVYCFQSREEYDAFQRLWINDGAPEMVKKPYILESNLVFAIKDQGIAFPDNYSEYGLSPVIVVYNDRSKVEITMFEDALKGAGVEVFLQDAHQANRIIYSTDAETIRREIADQYSEVYSGKAFLDEFQSEIDLGAKYRSISTGFDLFDRALDGGIFPDLYCLGGGTGSGKTTFCLNMALDMARRGEHILMIALEMSRSELFAKMISCLSYEICKEHGIDPDRYAQSTRNILKGGKFQESKEDRFVRESAIALFKRDVAKNLYIYESIGNCTVKTVEQEVKDHIRHTGYHPCVFVDYLQIMSHPDKYIRANDKLKTDENILSLKQLSRDYEIPVFVISILNRETYKDMTQEVTLTSFKESGAIEYSCAVVLALQLSKVTDLSLARRNEKDNKDQIARLKGEIPEDAETNPRMLDVKVLKNRHDGNRSIIRFSFHGECNRFLEIERVNTKRSQIDLKKSLNSYDD